MTKEQVGARIPADQHERLMEFKEARGISKSETVRRLIVSGLDHQNIAEELEEVREEMHEEREKRIRLETEVEQKDERIAELEGELEEAEQDAQKWKARYEEATTKLKLHHSEKGAVDRVREWLFG